MAILKLKGVMVSSASFCQRFVRSSHNGRYPGRSPPDVPRAPTSYGPGWPAGAPRRPIVAQFDPFPDDPHNPEYWPPEPQPEVQISGPLKVHVNNPPQEKPDEP